MGKGRKNAIKTVTCQVDNLRLAAGNAICLIVAGLKIVWRAVFGLNLLRIWACATNVCYGSARIPII
jgi:hypothetical protein